MLAIGLGKQKGAETYHQAMYAHGFPHVLQSVARTVLQNTNVLFGVGVVEDAYAQTASLNVLLPAQFEEREKELLKTAKKLAARLPFEDVDVLIIDEMGKEISGAGFDTKVVGRINLPLRSKEPESPRVKRIVVCDLTEKTEGNAAGVGIADLITRRLADKINLESTVMNCLSSGDPEGAKIPVALESDREMIRVAIRCVGSISHDKLKAIRIKNTLRLGEVDVSEAYRDELMERKDLEIVHDERPMTFDSLGNLTPF
jgi:hypothetical protein